MKNKYFFLGLFLVLIYQILPSSQYLRKLAYDYIPSPTEIVDQIDYPYIGHTLKKYKIANGWSMMDFYKSLGSNDSTSYRNSAILKENIYPSISNIKQFDYPIYTTITANLGKGPEYLTLVSPYIDHPPFGSLIYSFGVDSSIASISDIKPSQTRQVSLIISITNSILIYIFVFLFSNNLFTALLSSLIYSTIPIFILSSRFTLLENILIPLSLLSLIFLKLFQNSKKLLFLFLSSLSTSLALLTKISGIYIFFICLWFLLSNKSDKKTYYKFIAPIFILNILYFLYIEYLSPGLFLSMLKNQSGRTFFGSLNFLTSIIRLNFTNFPTESYWLFGFISFLFLKKKSSYLVSFILITVISIFFIAGPNYAWYYLPLIPFYVYSISEFVTSLLKKPSTLKSLIFFFLPFSTSFHYGYELFHTNSLIIYRLFLIIFAIFPIIFSKFRLIWIVIFMFILIQTNQWNFQSFQYIIANWSK